MPNGVHIINQELEQIIFLFPLTLSSSTLEIGHKLCRHFSLNFERNYIRILEINHCSF